MRWMNLEPIIQSEESQKEKDIVFIHHSTVYNSQDMEAT